VRGNFGDPRTIFVTPLSARGLWGSGAFSFHDGVDIAAHVNTPVYPVVSGRARVLNAETVEVRTADDRRFKYVHLRLAIRTGAEVKAGETVIGYIRKPWRHVHLAEIDPIPVHGVPDSGYRLVNPLAHLVPYSEHAAPTVRRVLARDLNGHRRPLTSLRGRVRLIADAFTYPADPVPGVWHDMPVAPALIRWRLLNRSGRVAIRWHTAIDLRQTLPTRPFFWRVYARGSYQNFPQIGERYYYRRPGRYLFVLTPDGLNTRPLLDGRYTLSVQTADICGNTRTRNLAVRIENRSQTVSR
jgi:hypothetical protein